MRLTNFTDYALRLLLLVQAAEGRLVTIEQAATRLHLSRANLMKVANELTSAGLLTGIRGRAGGLKLAKPASEIRIGDVVRAMETDFALVECLGDANDCAIVGLCRLPRVFRKARQAFFAELDEATLADVSLRPALTAETASERAGVSDETVTDGDMIDPSDEGPGAPQKAPSDSTRGRILQAFADILEETGDEDVVFDQIAQAAGVERRTVFRHFPNRDALLQAFWQWIGTRIGPHILPGSLDELLDMPPRIYAGFDAHEPLIRASLHSPSGRAMRLQALPERRRRFAEILREGLPSLPEAARRDVEALSHLLVSASAWETLKDYAGLSGPEAGETVSRALKRMIARLDQQDKETL